MTTLAQIVAVEKGEKAKGKNKQTALYHEVQKTQLLNGLIREYTPKEDGGDQLPSESTPVQLKVGKIIEDLQSSLTRVFDVVLTKETANTTAVADITVDGNKILEDVPVTYLLFLEKELENISTFINRIPALDPSEEWTYDPNTGVYRSEPTRTVRNKKVPKNWVKAEATQHHPAQVEIYHEDVLAGTWATTKFSGALPADRIEELRNRVDKLRNAVKFAREAANSIAITDQKAGAAIFGYLFS